MIASATESHRSTERTRILLVFSVVIFAVVAAISTLAAIHFRHQVTQLHGHVSVASSTPAAVLSSPVRQAAPTSAVSSPAASTPSSTVSPVVSAPPLTARPFELAMSRPHVTVDLTAADADGVGFTDGQLLVTALVRGGQPGARYRLAGGDCDLNDGDKVWAEGVADTTGTALLIELRGRFRKPTSTTSSSRLSLRVQPLRPSRVPDCQGCSC